MNARPYPGLRPFRRDEADIYFGRDAQVDELLEKLAGSRFLAVVGPSGCGKSSLVRAGMIDALETGFMSPAGPRWRFAEMRPGGHPVSQLAEALIQPEALAPERSEQPDAVAFIRATLSRGPWGLAEVLRETPLPPKTNLLVLVDQFEELFRYSREVDADEAAAFVQLLLQTSAAPDLRVYVVLTMRSDFLGDCALFRGLPEAMNDSQYLTPRLTRDQQRAAIEDPPQLFDGSVTPELVSRLLNDMGPDPDQLPLMQHALMRMWTRSRNGSDSGHALTLQDYLDAGGLANALSRHADEAFEALDAQQQQIAEKVFRCLTERTTSSRDIRRPRSLAHVAEVAEASLDDVRAIVDAFRHPDRSFLTPPAGAELLPDSILDISHESLIRQWKRLGAWVEAEARDRAEYGRLIDAAERFAAGEAGLWRDPELQLAIDWLETAQPSAAWAAQYEGNFDAAMGFLEESRTARDVAVAEEKLRQEQELQRAKALAEAEKQAADAERKRAEDASRSARRLRRFALALILAAFAAVTFGVIAWMQLSKVQEERRKAEAFAAEALRNEARADSLRIEEEKKTAQIAEFADSLRLSQAATMDALQLANANLQEAIKQREIADSVSRRLRRSVQIADSSFLAARAAEQRATEAAARLKVELNRSKVRAVAAEAVLLQQRGDDMLALLLARQAYNLHRQNPLVLSEQEVYEALRKTLNAPQFSRLGQPRGGPLRMRRHLDWARTVAFHPDGDIIASGGGEGTVYLWRPESDWTLELKGHSGSVRDLAFSPVAGLLATGGDDGSVRLWWNMERQQPATRRLSGHADRVRAVAFSPDGNLLATGSVDGDVRIWDISDMNQALTNSMLSTDGTASSVNLGSLPATHKKLRAGKSIRDLVFDPTGLVLIGADDAGQVRWWAVDGSGEPIDTLDAGDGPTAIAIQDGGTLLAAGDENGRLRIFDWVPGRGVANRTPRQLPGHNGGITSAAFSPDGKMLATGSYDRSVRLWDMDRTSSALPVILREHESWIWSVAFSPGGNFLATGSADRSIGLWTTRLETLAKRACEAATRDLTDAEWESFFGDIARQQVCTEADMQPETTKKRDD